MKTTIPLMFLLVISLFGLAGCSSKKVEVIEEEIVKHTIMTVKQGEDIIINTNDINSNATYYNYEIDGYIIQIFAVKASDGTVRIAFNTCGACNPSPSAYFVQKGEYFECQNCGNKFKIDEIGLTNRPGCFPIGILDDNKNIDGDNITISSSFIETYKQKFETINIYEN